MVDNGEVSRPFRIAIVGCGRIANAHLQAMLALPDVELAALVDPVEERSRLLADRYRIRPGIATRVGEVLDRVDGVIIATPNNTHADIAVECLGRGVSTLIEKPLAASVDEGRRIQHAAEGSGAIAAVGYVTRFRENIQFMRTLLRTRAFGRVRRFAYQFGTKGGWAPVSAYNLDRASTGGGVLVVTGTHFLDRMLDWFGYPADATLRDDSRGGPEANAVASFVFDTADGPLRGTVRFSKSVNLEAGLVLDTEAGIVIFKDRPDAEVTVRPAQTSDIEQRWSHRALGPRRRRPAEFVLQLQDFIQAARTRGAPMVPAEKGLESLRLIEQLYANSERLPDAFYERANQAAVIS